MASSRPRRSITAPKKFGEEEGYLLPTREVHNARKVYRLLNEGDLAKDLRNQTVFVLWPDDKEWYEAKITKVDRSNLDAKLEYSDTQEEEEVNLALLVKDHHIAFMEFRSLSDVLGPDDILIDSLDGLEDERASLPHPGLVPESVDGEGLPQSIVDELTPPLVAQETIREEELVQPSGAHGGMASLQDRVIGTNAARFDGSAAVLHALGQRGAMGVQTAGIIPVGTSGVGPVGVVHSNNESVGFTDYVDMQALGSIVGGVHSDVWPGCSLLGGGGVRHFAAAVPPHNINYNPLLGSLHHPPTATTTAGSGSTVNRPSQSFQNLLHPVLRAVSSSGQPSPPQAVLHPGAPLFDGYAIQQRRDPGLMSGANPGVLLGSNTLCVQSSNRGMEVETGPGREAISIETLIDALQQPAPKRARSPTFDAVLVSQGAHAAKKPRSDPALVSQSIASMLEPDVSQMAYPPMGMPPMQFAQFAQMPQGLHPNQQLQNLPHVMHMQQQFGHLAHPVQLALDAQRPLSTVDPHAQEAAEMEDFSRNLLAGILGKKAQEEENQQKQATAQQVPGGAQPGVSVIREKICSQFVADLEIAVKELKKDMQGDGEGKEEGKEGSDGEGEKEATKEQEQEEEYDANAVGAAVEEELFQLCGSANKEYKSKARSLHFNLKDQKNPDLRGQVLVGHITPHALVRMSAQELASSEEKKWREKKAEEFLKQSVLDTETAAAFSTAAALKKSKELRNERDVDPIPVAATDHIDQDQTLTRKKSLGGESGVGAEEDDVVKVKSGGATELSNPEFDIAEALRKAESENVAIEQEKHDLMDETGTGAEGENEEFRHIEVPPSPPLSPLRSSSDDEVLDEEVEAQQPDEKELESNADVNDENEGTGQDEKSGAAVYDPLSPAVFNEGDATFDYSGDEGPPDWALPGDETKEVKEKEAAGDVEMAEAEPVGGDASGNGTSYSPLGGAKSAYSPTAGWDDDIEDLAPIVLMPKSGVLSVGAKVWEGRVSGDSGDSFRVVCECVAGMGDLGLMLGTEEISIKGRVGLDKVETFLNDLRPSQNRTVTLGIMKLHGDATTPEQTFLSELIAQYSTKGRTAVIGPGPNLEGYLVSRCNLSARLCLTARNAVPLDQKTFVKDNIRANGELLLVLIHRKDWKPPSIVGGPPTSLRGKGDIVGQDSKPETVGTEWAGPNVMEWAGMSKEIAAEAGVEVENGGAGGQNEPSRGSDPRLKDPRLRAGIREVDTNKKTEMQGEIKKSGLPPGVTPEAISDLAALFGIKGKGGAAAAQQSLFSQLGGLGGPAQGGGGAGSGLQDPRQSSHHGASTSGSQIPGQMTIGGTGGMHGFSSNQQFSQMPTGFNQQPGQRVEGLPGQGQQMQVLQVAQGGQQQSVVLLQGKPQFLSYDPTTGKAVPLDPSTIQYDPATNQVMLLGPLPPGAPYPGQMPQGQMGMMPQAVEQDRLLVNSQGIPILVKKAKKEGMGEGDMDVEEEEAGQRVQLANLGMMGTLQRNVQGYNGEVEVQQIDPMRGMQAGLPGMIPQMVQPPPPPPVQGQQDPGVSGGMTRGYGGGGGGVSGQQGGRGRGRGRDDRRRMRGRGRSRRDHGGGNHVSRGGGSKGSHYRDRSAAGNSEV